MSRHVPSTNGAFAVGRLLLSLLCPALAWGQEPAQPAPSTEAEAREPWSARLSVNGYFLKDASDYLQPTVAADRGLLHLEGRYNYEGQRTGSLWVGTNFEVGETLKLSITPMFGVVFGDFAGFAPGLEWSLSWHWLTLYAELELVLSLDDSSGNYFYVWSELSAQPLPWLRAGLALQRTRATSEPRLVQWGPLVGVAVWKLTMTAYWFNPGQSSAQYWVVSLGIGN